MPFKLLVHRLSSGPARAGTAPAAGSGRMWSTFALATVLSVAAAEDVNSGTRVMGLGVGTFVVVLFAVLAVAACIASCGTTATR